MGILRFCMDDEKMCNFGASFFLFQLNGCAFLLITGDRETSCAGRQVYGR